MKKGWEKGGVEIDIKEIEMVLVVMVLIVEDDEKGKSSDGGRFDWPN